MSQSETFLHISQARKSGAHKRGVFVGRSNEQVIFIDDAEPAEVLCACVDAVYLLKPLYCVDYHIAVASLTESFSDVTVSACRALPQQQLAFR
jgi:hypothetical protein